MHDVDYIFHAAALKQVPSCEFFPVEAVKTNVLGTDNVLTAAIECGVKNIVCLSTDKAAYPVNAMGTSKAMMEKVIVAKSRTVKQEKTKICCTRYGNVLCSRGSVVPLWIDQIKAGNPITITEPEMTRFIMSLDEAVDLVLFAFENGTSGDILVQKAPACTIEVLAKAVTELLIQDMKSKLSVFVMVRRCMKHFLQMKSAHMHMIWVISIVCHVINVILTMISSSKKEIQNVIH